MNLICDAWLPVRRRSGAEERIAPWQVAERLADDPVVALASPRADFDGALAQFWIGLLQTAIAPADDAEWGLWLTQPDPARLRRALEPLAETGEDAPACGLCAEPARPAVSQYLALNLGVNYTGPWEHPLTPHGIDFSGLPFPLKGGQAGPSYRHWLGLVQESRDLRRHPAAVVSELDRRTERREGYRLWVFGYDMDNRKARAWVEGTLPLPSVEPALRPRYEGQVAALALAARFAERALAEAAREAVSPRPQDLAGDPGDLPARFWEETEALFLDHLRQLRRDLARGGDGRAVRASWHYGLSLVTREIFELFCGHGPAATAAPRRIAQAWKSLRKALQGPRMLDLLDLTSPQNAFGTERGASLHERVLAAASADRLRAVQLEP